MDTEFPGVVARPIGEFKSTSDYQYQVSVIRDSLYRADINLLFYFLQLLRCNVDLLKIIQLGLTFFNKEGGTPEGVCTWQVTAPYGSCLSLFLTAVLFQFNFKFNLSEDMYAEDSVELLQVSTNSKDWWWCLIFAEFRDPIWAAREGGNWNCSLCWDSHRLWHCPPWQCQVAKLSQWLWLWLPPQVNQIGSNFVIKISWINKKLCHDILSSFSMLTNVNLPEGEAEFFDTLNVYFPNIYDVKYLMKSCKNLKGGLQVGCSLEHLWFSGLGLVEKHVSGSCWHPRSWANWASTSGKTSLETHWKIWKRSFQSTHLS